MDYFSKFLRPSAEATPKAAPDHAQEFDKAWSFVKNTLMYPDERQLSKGIQSTTVPARLQTMVDMLVAESTRMEAGATGPCMELLLQNDILGTLVRLSETDRPAGIQAEVLRAVQNMVVLLDEQFLAHAAVHKAILRLLRNCVGDDIQEQLDGKKIMGAAGNAVRSQPSEYEEDLVHLLCILCSRIRTYRELLIIFFHDKHWFRSEPLFSVEEENEEEEEEEEDADSQNTAVSSLRAPSPTPSQATIKSAPVSRKAEYEFLLFNYLLRFVHREGKIGDFARAGLLFLMDVAMSPGENLHSLVESDVPSVAGEAVPVDPNSDAALALAEYIVDGDFSEVLGAGLAAVYSLLPSKLEIKSIPAANKDANLGMTIGSTGPETEDQKEEKELTREKNQAIGLEESTSLDFKARLDHFLKLMEFLQDILRRNVHGTDDTLDPSMLVGNAIVNSILDAVRRTFLENVLYPSILECSDVDGSAVAVMSYIETMISTLRPDQLANLVVEFLISEDNDQILRSQPKRQTVVTLGGSAPPQSGGAISDKDAKARRRQSMAMTFLEMEAPDSTKPSEYFTSMERFTLKDLLLANLRSDSHATAAAALKLMQTMLARHCQLCIDKLLVVSPDPHATSFPEPLMLHDHVPSPVHDDDDDDDTFIYPGSEEPLKPFESLYPMPSITISTHEREMNLYLTLVSRVDPSHTDDAFSTGYENYLRDALQAIEDQPCFHADMEPEKRSRRKHRLNPNDPILSAVLESLRTFFANTPEFNIALTGVLATLALCPDRALAGWLTFAVKERDPRTVSDFAGTLPDDGSDGDDRSIDFTIEEQLATEQHQLPAASVDEQSRPVVHSIFLGLVSQLERYRQQVDDFDKYLLERRQGLLFSENLTDALTLSLEPDLLSPGAPSPAASRPETPRPKPRPTVTSSLVSFLTPKKGKSVSAAPATPEPSTPHGRRVDASPFAPHYKQTVGITVEPYAAPVPTSGPWTPAKKNTWAVDEDDVFSASGQWGDTRGSLGYGEESGSRADHGEAAGSPKRVTLSHLLDNVVVLEESMKELVAIIQARRSLGIDALRYL